MQWLMIAFPLVGKAARTIS